MNKKKCKHLKTYEAVGCIGGAGVGNVVGGVGGAVIGCGVGFMVGKKLAEKKCKIKSLPNDNSLLGKLKKKINKKIKFID